MLNEKTIASSFSALSHPLRVRIFGYLLTCQPRPVAFGVLSRELGVPASTLAHHLREMEAGRVVTRRAAGRRTLFAPDLAHLQRVLSDFLETCCAGDVKPSERKSP